MKDTTSLRDEPSQIESCGGKRVYKQPKLESYGQVTDLTRSGTISCQGDNATCTYSSNMSGALMASDRATKDNIRRVGTHPLGIGLYLFDYKLEYRVRCGQGRHFGVMADEVERVMPQAVTLHPDGYKMVYYDMLGVKASVH